MFKNHTILIFSHTNPDNICDFLTQTAEILSNKNNVYIYTNFSGISIYKLMQALIKGKKYKFFTKKGNYTIITPIYLIPFGRKKIISHINQLFSLIIITFKIPKKERIFWTFDPLIYKLSLFFCKHFYSIIYDIVDLHSLPTKQKNDEITIYENRLIKSADINTTNSFTLLNHHKKIKTNIFPVPNGFKIQQFKSTTSLKTKKFKNKKPIIGFHGHINERIDVKLLSQLIQDNKQWQFVFIGPIKHDPAISQFNKISQLNKIQKFPNVMFIGQVSSSYIPDLIKQFDIAIIPYDIGIPFNKSCFPMKTMEYFYQGKPIISTPIKELTYYSPYIFTHNNPKEWEKQIKHILSKSWIHSRKQKQIATSHSWENKIRHISYLYKLKTQQRKFIT